MGGEEQFWELIEELRFGLKDQKKRGGLTSLEVDDVCLLQFVTSNWVCAIFRDILCDESALIDVARLDRDNRILRRLAGDCAENHSG